MRSIRAELLSGEFNRTGLVGNSGNDQLSTSFDPTTDSTSSLTGKAVQTGNASDDSLAMIIRLLQGTAVVDTHQGRWCRRRHNQCERDGAKRYGDPHGYDQYSTINIHGGSGDGTVNARIESEVAAGDIFGTIRIGGGAGDDWITAFASNRFTGFEATSINQIDGGSRNDHIDATAVFTVSHDGSDVVVSFSAGTQITFAGLGNGHIDSWSDFISSRHVLLDPQAV